MTDELFGTYRILRRPNGELWELDRDRGWATFKAVEVNLELSVALTLADIGLLATDEQVTAFNRRSRELMRADSPSVGRMVNAGRMGEQYFYATQLPKGASLDEYVVREGPIPWAGAVRAILQVVAALEAANQCDVLHAGLVPQRVILHRAAEWHLVPEVQVVGFDLFGVSRAEAPLAAPAELSIDNATTHAVGELLQLMLAGKEQPQPGGPFFLDMRPVAFIPAPIQIILDRLLADAGAHPPYTFRTLRTALHDAFLVPPLIIPGQRLGVGNESSPSTAPDSPVV